MDAKSTNWNSSPSPLDVPFTKSSEKCVRLRFQPNLLYRFVPNFWQKTGGLFPFAGDGSRFMAEK